jgi:hypothetical protein
MFFFNVRLSLDSAVKTITFQFLHPSRVARFFLEHDNKTGKNVPNEHKMVMECPKCPQNIPDGHKI